MRTIVPPKLRRDIGQSPAGDAWLQRLPGTVADLADRWSLTIESSIIEEATCSWVAICHRSDGSSAILKLGFPHMEAEHEIDGLRFWSGDPTVHLLKVDRERNAMLLECCIPGTPLRSIAEEEQDVVIAQLLRRLWRVPAPVQPFRPLARMIEYWCTESSQKSDLWPDKALAKEGIRVFEELLSDQRNPVLLATDLHAGNVLRAQRKQWLVIDPKPFFGDPCYDATQHLLNCRDRLRTNPTETIKRFANLLEVDEQRVRQWTFARLAVECTAGIDMAASHVLARCLSS